MHASRTHRISTKRNAILACFTSLTAPIHWTSLELIDGCCLAEVARAMVEAWAVFVGCRWLVEPHVGHWKQEPELFLPEFLNQFRPRGFIPMFEVSTSHLLVHVFDRASKFQVQYS